MVVLEHREAAAHPMIALALRQRKLYLLSVA
jgi:hypothetical protein